MGMASSQVRLLMITSRLHDIEHKAMCLQDEKLILATQSDQISKDFTDALDSYSLAIEGKAEASGSQASKPIKTTFSNLTGRDAINTGARKILKDSNSNKVIVEDNIARAYAEYKGEDPYEFAMLILDKSAYDSNRKAMCEERIFEKYKDSDASYDKQMVSIKEKMDNILGDNGVKSSDELPEKEKKEYKDLETSFLNNLYTNHGAEILKEISGENEYTTEDIKFYADLFNVIKASGGCVSIDDYDLNKTDGINASEDPNLVDHLVNTGKAVIYALETNDNGDITQRATSPSVESSISNVPDTSIDKAELMKAQAKYESESKKIDNKEKRIDQELSKLETERTALTTQYDSVKKVIDDNVERTFGIFS